LLLILSNLSRFDEATLSGVSMTESRTHVAHPVGSAKHLASWAGVCPGNRQSAGKRLSGAITGGNPYLRSVLTQAAWAVSHTKNNYVSAQYHRLARRIGRKKAIVALAHTLLVIIYHVLQTQKPYTELGADYFDKLDTTRIQQHHIHRLEQLGFTVMLTPKEVA
jgi:transposase